MKKALRMDQGKYQYRKQGLQNSVNGNERKVLCFCDFAEVNLGQSMWKEKDNLGVPIYWFIRKSPYLYPCSQH